MITRIFLILTMAGALIGCRGPAKRQSPDAGKSDTFAAESLKEHYPREFPRSQIAKVVSYAFLFDESDDSSLRGQHLEIMPGYVKFLRKSDSHAKLILNKKQIADLLSIIQDSKTYRSNHADCDYPRNIFCFYNDRNEIIAFYEICFECGRFNAYPFLTDSNKRIGLSQTGGDRLERFCRSAGVVTK